MSSATVTVREEVRHLVDELPESELHAALRFLEYLRDYANDPVLRSVENAPFDDEPLTEEDIKALDQAHRSIAEGHVLSDEEFQRRVLES